MVELLVVVSIIALLLAIFLPSLLGARRKARNAVCKAYAYQLTQRDMLGQPVPTRVAGRAAVKLKLNALDCGCYGDAGEGLSGMFTLPPGVSEAEFRRQLEAQLTGSPQ